MITGASGAGSGAGRCSAAVAFLQAVLPVRLLAFGICATTAMSACSIGLTSGSRGVQRDAPPLMLVPYQSTGSYRFPAMDAEDARLSQDAEAGGKVSYDAETRILTYTPSADDSEPFTVTLSGTSPSGEPVAEKVAIEPVVGLPPETRYIETARPLPALPLYNSVVVRKASESVNFNGTKRTTREAEVTGFEVHFDPHDETAALNRFDDENDLEALTIRADRVVIRGELRLPQTQVHIYAHELVFEDPDKDTAATIATTPLSWFGDASDGNNNNVPSDGATGADGGSIFLYVNALTASGGTRFIMDGGRGQDPEQGRPGPKGRSASSTTVEFKGKTYKNVIYHRHTSARITSVPAPDSVSDTGTGWDANRKDPSNGGRGIAAGRPGDGGNGGTLYAPDPDWGRYARQDGGEAGQPFGPYPGGPPGSPSSWVKLRTRTITSYIQQPPMTVRDDPEVRTGRVHAGPPSAVRKGEHGHDGKIELIDPGKGQWVTPELIRISMNRLHDVYLAGRIVEAQKLVRSVGAMTDVAIAGRQQVPADLRTTAAEVEVIAHRLAAGLDYFGNPPGWVPNLSLEVNYGAFQREIDNAIRVMYLEFWLERYWKARDNRITALDSLIKLQRSELEDQRNGYRNASRLLPALLAEKQRLKSQADDIARRLSEREQQLMKQAESSARARAVMQTLSFMGEKLIFHQSHPGYAIATAALSDAGRHILDPGGPGTPTSAIPGVYEQLVAGDEANAARYELARMDPAKVTDPDAYAAQLVKTGETIGRGSSETRQALLSNFVQDDVMLAELQRLKAQDPSFNSLIDDLQAYLGVQQVFTEKLIQTQQLLDTSAIQLARGWESVSALDHARSEQQASIPPVTRNAVEQLGATARDRLIRYQYYLAKAYEYRVLEPYPGDFTKNRLFERLRTDFAQAADGTSADAGSAPQIELDGEAFKALKAIYIDELSAVASAILRDLNENRPNPINVVHLLKFTRDDLKRLNTEGVVAIDLADRGLVSDSDVDARIESVEVAERDSRFSLVRGRSTDASVSVLELTVEPAGQTVMRWGGESYLFDYRRQGVDSVRWGYSWDGLTGEGHPILQSNDTRSLLSRLFDDPGIDTSRIRFLPGARGKLLVRKEVKADDKSIDAQVDALTLKVSLQLHKDFNLAVLNVDAGYGALVRIDQPDLNGRQNGRSRFSRIYVKGQKVTVSAPERIGTERFAAWVDGNGARVGDKSSMEVVLNYHVFLRPIYRALN